MLDYDDQVGIALTQDEETALLNACGDSRSRSLYIVVVIALGNCMRHNEIRLLRWNQVDFAKSEVRVGKSKTRHGTGRVIPMSPRVRTVLEFWAERFPDRKLNHYVFPRERCGGKGRDDVFGFTGGVAYDIDPTLPIGDWKEAWEAAKIRAGVTCRFHALRPTGC